MNSKSNIKIFKKFIFIFILLLLPLTVSGCWGKSGKINRALNNFKVDSEVTEDFALPSANAYLKGSVTVWKSSNPAIINIDRLINVCYAEVFRPSYRDITVTLTVTITYNDASESREFAVKVLKLEGSNPSPNPNPNPKPNPTPGPGPSNPDTSDLKINIEDVDYGLIKSSEINDITELTFDKTSKPKSLDVIDEYFLIIKYTLTPYKNNSGQVAVKAKIRLDNIKYVQGTLFEIKGGNKGEGQNVETDNQTGEKFVNIPITSIVSSEADASSQIFITIKLKTLNAGSSFVELSFESTDARLVGEISGISRAIDVNKVKLESPVIAYDESSKSIKFNNVLKTLENTDGKLVKPGYYKVFIDGELLKGSDGKDYIVEIDEYVDYNAELSISMIKINQIVNLTSFRIKIQAFSSSTNLITSNYSNEVDIII